MSDNTEIELPEADFKLFVETLANPPVANNALKRAFEKRDLLVSEVKQ